MHSEASKVSWFASTSPMARLTTALTVEPPSDSLPLRCRRESRAGSPTETGRERTRHCTCTNRSQQYVPTCTNGSKQYVQTECCGCDNLEMPLFSCSTRHLDEFVHAHAQTDRSNTSPRAQTDRSNTCNTNVVAVRTSMSRDGQKSANKIATFETDRNV